jgi:hypothetical protein
LGTQSIDRLGFLPLKFLDLLLDGIQLATAVGFGHTMPQAADG